MTVFLSDPFNEHDKIDKEMKQLEDELRKLCCAGTYDKAIIRAREELAPLHKKWLDTLYQSLNNVKKDPSYYQPS